MAEARNLRNMTLQQTPLLGDENAAVHEMVGRPGSGFEGATPARSVQATPNPLATPFRKPGEPDVAATPRSVHGAPGATPLRTPMRDSLAINTPSREASVSETPREQKHRLRNAQSALDAAFAALPKPKNDFELLLPEEEDEDEDIDAMDGVSLSAEDAADRDARIQARKAEEHRKTMARRSQAVKLGLPRPAEFDPSSLLYELQNAPEGSAEQELERLVAMEMVRLLEHDSIVHPVSGGKKAGGGKSSLEQLIDADLDKAREVVTVELGSALGYPGASEIAVKRAMIAQLDIGTFDTFWKPASDALVYDASTSSFMDRSSLSAAEIAKGQSALLDMYRKKMTSDAARAAKSEKKLSVVLGGYQARSKVLAAKLVQANDEVREANMQYLSFQRLAENEESAIPRRLEGLKKEVRDLERIEREGQMRYRTMNEQKMDRSKRIEDLEFEYAQAVNEAALEAMDEE